MEKAKTLLEIARIISGNDDDVLAVMTMMY